MISTPVELAVHLHTNRNVAKDLVRALAEDLRGNHEHSMIDDEYADILELGYERTRNASEIFGEFLELGEPLYTEFEDFVANPLIEEGTDWFYPISSIDDFWETTIEILSNIGVSESLTESFRHHLVIGSFMLVEEAGSAEPNSALSEVFGKIALEAFEEMERDGTVYDEFGVLDESEVLNKLIYLVAPRIGEWMGETIEAKGETLVLYALLDLIARDSD